MNKLLSALLICIPLLNTCLPIQAETLHIAVAANFSNTLKLLATEFESISNHTVVTTVGSTGALYAQIINGAPYDIFLAADQQRVDTLEQQGKTVINSTIIYACGQLVVATSDPTITPSLTTLKTDLQRNPHHRLTIANPKTAPYGQAALELLNNLQGAPINKKQIIQAQNISQTYQYVSNGDAHWGLIARSSILTASQSANIQTQPIHPNQHRPIQQKMALIKKNRPIDGAKMFLKFMQSQQAQDIIKQSGYIINPPYCNASK